MSYLAFLHIYKKIYLRLILNYLQELSCKIKCYYNLKVPMKIFKKEKKDFKVYTDQDKKGRSLSF